MKTETDPMIVVKRAGLRYPSVGHIFGSKSNAVLQDINIAIRPGDKLGVIGLNGSGKSSLLRLLGGILKPTSGCVERKMGLRTSLLALGVGFVGDLTGRDNAIMSAILQGASRQDALKLLPKIKEFSELGDTFEAPARTYSSGMRARLAFSTSLFIEVDVLLIDEALAVGDTRFRKKAAERMQQKLTGQQTLVLVSHGEEQIRQLCNTAILLEKGRQIYSGGVAATLDRYADLLSKTGH